MKNIKLNSYGEFEIQLAALNSDDMLHMIGGGQGLSVNAVCQVNTSFPEPVGYTYNHSIASVNVPQAPANHSINGICGGDLNGLCAA